MNREKPIRDQAERLRKKVERKSEPAVEKKNSLPPRSEIHRQKQKKTNVKIKYPVIRLMALFFILLPISLFSIISYLDKEKGPFNQSQERAGAELINVESHSDDAGLAQEKEVEGAPSYEEISEPEKREIVAAAPDPSSSSDKDTPEKPDVISVKETEIKEAAPASTPVKVDAAKDNPAPSAGAAGEKIVYHTVKQGETLFRVAMTYYKSQEGIPIIKKANNLHGNEIQSGQVLKIPMKK